MSHATKHVIHCIFSILVTVFFFPWNNHVPFRICWCLSQLVFAQRELWTGCIWMKNKSFSIVTANAQSLAKHKPKSHSIASLCAVSRKWFSHAERVNSFLQPFDEQLCDIPFRDRERLVLDQGYPSNWIDHFGLIIHVHDIK